MKAIIAIASAVLTFAVCEAFAPQCQTKSGLKPLRAIAPKNDEEAILSDRRKALYTVVGASSSFIFTPFAMAEDSTMGSDPSKPIAVIGAGGKVGKICTNILNKKGLYTRAVTRSGKEIMAEPLTYVSYSKGDVTNYEAIKLALEDCSGVIFTASASGKKKGGDPAHVDYLGLYNTAKACLELGVPKLVVVSAGSVTRPSFIGYKATNLFVAPIYGPNIMGYKIAGENAMRDLYSKQNKCSYCVVRPGGLSDAPAEGPSKIHVSQGDIYSAEINRDDVAEVAIAALLKGSATDNTTFELNNIKGLSKVSKDLDEAPEELVHAGAASYEKLLDGLFSDKDMRKLYPQYMNDFNGGNIEPISEIA
mmetsp:Transcript_17151/g.32475  ORF Transcript_17151/g.32475 Transcript_17151/m.32475 type:complete len:363 (+) Transcript_17151:104-1192(+)